MEKFMKVRFASSSKEVRASRVRKAVERDLSSSTEMQGSRGGDFELWQINHRVNRLVCLLVFLLTDLPK
jgi:hypothetical protein